MSQTSRIVAVTDGVQVVKVTTHDSDGNPVERHYLVQGVRYDTLKQAMKAARDERKKWRLAECGRPANVIRITLFHRWRATFFLN